jgi:hypothetical protein
MTTRRERQHAVIAQTVGSAPDERVAVPEQQALRLVRAPGAAEQEHRRQAERDRDDGRGEIALVAVLVQRQARAGGIAVDQAGIGDKARESGLQRRALRELGKSLGQRRQGLAAVRIDRRVAVAAAVRHPAEAAAVAHDHRHGAAAGNLHLAERRSFDDPPQAVQQRGYRAKRIALQQRSARPETLDPVRIVAIEQVGADARLRPAGHSVSRSSSVRLRATPQR